MNDIGDGCLQPSSRVIVFAISSARSRQLKAPSAATALQALSDCSKTINCQTHS